MYILLSLQTINAKDGKIWKKGTVWDNLSKTAIPFFLPSQKVNTDDSDIVEFEKDEQQVSVDMGYQSKGNDLVARINGLEKV